METKSTAANLTDVERLIEFELKRVADRRREYGWTPWALLLALAALGWQLLDRKMAAAQWPTIGLVWAMAILLGDYIGTLRTTLFVARNRSSGAPRFFEADWVLSGSRESMLVDGFSVYAACLLVLGWGDLHGFVLAAWVAFTVLSAGQVPFCVGLSYTHYGISTQGWQARLVQVGLVLRFLTDTTAAILVACVAFRLHQSGVEIEAIKTAALLVVATLLLSWLAEFRIATPMEERLIQLRRAIGLAELDASTAQLMVDEALHGMQPGSLIQRHVATLDEAVARVTKLHENAHQLLVKASTHAAVNQLAAAEASTAQARLEMTAAGVAVKSLSELKQRLFAHLVIVVAQHPKIGTEQAKLLTRFKDVPAAQQRAQAVAENEFAGAEGALAQFKKPLPPNPEAGPS